ncbi:hypothetical protein B0H21DRAFT_699332 [Amylocystis lapponica]|nr:hypothetical protein B0H21DRAFT_699332 [Amylocystis lapponica]
MATPPGFGSTMHRVLQIPEIVGLIFSHMDDRDNARNACVCKRWSDIALDTLWSNLDRDLRRLFSLLAPVVSHSPMGLAFSRALTPDDWARFSKYAVRVRQLRYYEDQEPRLYRSSMFDEIARTRTTLNILPHLHTLEWHSIQPERCRSAVVFMHENIKHFSVRLHKSTQYPLSDFFMDVAVRMPALVHLDLCFTFPVHEIEGDLTALIRRLPKLRKIVLPLYTLTSKVVETLSTLQHLGTIQFEFMERQGQGDVLDLARFAPRLEEGAFPALWDLSLSAHLSDMTRFLSGSFSPTNLTSLYVHVLSAVATSTVTDFIVAVSENCQLLTHLYLELLMATTASELDVLERAGHWLTFDALRPILRCHRLIAFELRWALPLQISQDDIEELASQWPFLEMLTLNCEPVPLAPLTPSPLTLRALLPFAAHCPNLRELGLYLSATAADLDALAGGGTGNTPTFRSLARLRTGLSSITEPGPVALFLSALCPLGCEVAAGVSWPDGFGVRAADVDADVLEDMQGRAAVWYERWEEVGRVLPLLVRLRAEERARRTALEREVADLRVRCSVLEERATLKMAGDDSCVVL